MFTAMDPPPVAVLRAFGADAAPVRLAGGRGRSWRAGSIVLKEADAGVDELEWHAAVFGPLAAREGAGFRVAHSVRAATGSLIVDGWAAWEWLDGDHAPRWAEIIAAGDRFHAALAGEPRPPFIERRTDPWAIADRVAWEELPVDAFAEVEEVSRLAAARRPLAASAQLVHGDLTGNVLFADPLPPAIIDPSLYWRPPAFASAVVVADALAWHGADASILRAVANIRDFPQYLARALMFRIVTDVVAPGRGPDQTGAYRAAVELVERLVGEVGPGTTT